MKRKTYKILISLFVLALCMLAWARIEASYITVTNYTIQSSDIPPAFDGCRIVFAADIHNGPVMIPGMLPRIVTAINEIHPDYVIFGGDYVYYDYYHTNGEHHLRQCFEQLQHIKAEQVFALRGNHDHYCDDHIGFDKTYRYVTGSGFSWIENTGKWVTRGGDRIRICGVGDLWRGVQRIDDALCDADTKDFVVLVSHNPDYFDILRKSSEIYRTDLLLGAHTHGGQVTVLGWPLYMNSSHGQKYRGGITHENPPAIVTTGLGNVVAALRLFNPPEIVVITLKKSDSCTAVKAQYLNLFSSCYTFGECVPDTGNRKYIHVFSLPARSTKITSCNFLTSCASYLSHIPRRSRL